MVGYDNKFAKITLFCQKLLLQKESKFTLIKKF